MVAWSSHLQTWGIVSLLGEAGLSPYHNHRSTDEQYAKENNRETTSMAFQAPAVSSISCRTDACGMLDPCRIGSKSYLDLQPCLSGNSDKVPRALEEAYRSAAVARHC